MTPRSRRLLPVATIALLAVLPAGAGAAQLTVDSTADGPDATPGNGVCATGLGQCTLRAAIGEANALFGADAIVVPAGTYATGSPLTVSSTMSITGPAGARATVVDGAAGAAVLEISASAAGASVRGLTFTGAGRGIRVDAPDVVIDQVSVRGNAISGAATQYASGIFLGAPTARVLVTRSLITGNTVTSTLDQAQGAGITVWDSGASLTVVASTIADNQANGSGSGAFGGGVHVRFGSRAVLRHATLAGNRTTAGSVATSGGNLYATPAGPFAAAQAVVADSVLTGGQAVSGPNCFGPVIAEGRNIDSGTSCGFGAGHLTGTDPLLGALADNGGPTDSMAPGLASPARDQAALCPDGGLDQRGAPAPTGPACDIGAAELGADLGVSPAPTRSRAGT
ncbi:MAG: CSLREA domain-containing protein [Thermoleophilia bacterium]|nr:CSLREA domain-containing protein [Thermoleophilia bacterium]